MLNATSRLLCGAIAAALILFAVHAEAAVVSGIYTSPAGKPLPDHQLHFENRISGDMYLTRTGDDGSFASDLPPGTYDLRAERGLVVRPGIRVDGPEALNVGRVSDGAPFDVRRPFEREGILDHCWIPKRPRRRIWRARRGHHPVHLRRPRMPRRSRMWRQARPTREPGLPRRNSAERCHTAS